jgi:hypothetical protein
MGIDGLHHVIEKGGKMETTPAEPDETPQDSPPIEPPDTEPPAAEPDDPGELPADEETAAEKAEREAREAAQGE